MRGTHNHPPMTMHIAEEELRQALITIIAPETVKRGINSLSIPKFIWITNILLMMNINHSIENYVVYVVYIIMWLLSVETEWQQEKG